ncbi:hypothetical protein ES703_110189 [subsurface metagenome]
MKKNFIIILFLLVFAVFISGCINILLTPEDDSIAPGKGRLKIYLTDSSEDYKAGDAESYLAVNITISEIKVHFAGDDDNDEGEWIEWVLAKPSEYNLIELKDVFVLLSEGELASGKYTQIRLFVTEASVSVEIEKTGEDSKLIEVADEVPPDTIDVEIPSAYQTGLKLIYPFEINDGQTTKLTIDFDAEKSIIKTDNGEYKLKPTIKVTSQLLLI